MKINITHLTSVHARYDTRIFVKECSSLVKNENYQVSLIVADGNGDEVKNEVHIFDVGAKTGGRISRMTNTVKKVFEKAVELDSDIYHMHDPELIPVGLKLKKIGKKVIFDAHEDTPKQLRNAPYLNTFFRTTLSGAYGIFERFTLAKFDYIITATPYIREKFLSINKNSIDINNFPILEELGNNTPWNEKKDEICYVGGIAKIRGIKELIRAMESVKNVRLNLAGKFIEKDVENEVKKYAGWSKVNEFGFVGRKEIADILSRSKAGIVTLHPIINYQDALPVKMFEYMAAGIPVIASNIPLWQEIIEGTNCGICVDPMKPSQIADAINFIMTHQDVAQKMGANGKKAVFKKYNWGIEEAKFLRVYEEIIR
ncbi:MAG: glycosyltransferase [Sulfurovaceae bacterium]|nr:glycosyltransferase [Sulfurovaceae bacterium]